MKMIPLSDRQAVILNKLRQTDRISAEQLRQTLGDISIATIKREMKALVLLGYTMSSGRGRGSGYALTKLGELLTPVDAHAYCAQEPDARGGFESFDSGLLSATPGTVFTDAERARLEAATTSYQARAREISETLTKKELERFVIELSWKSSRIEGNTYTLFDTERLIREGISSEGHSPEEAAMIINHKRAFEFVYANRQLFSGEPSRAAVEEVHRLLVEGLNVGSGLRRQMVGIVGTRYRPLDNQFQINEALDELRRVIGRVKEPYTAALIALLGISYIQPFEDGNKRTARLLVNAVLLARSCAPLSYRSVDEIAYREATLVFYETHSLAPFRDIFVEQYLFAAEQYGLK